MGISVCFLVLQRMGGQLKDSVCIWCRFPYHLFGYLWQTGGTVTSKALGPPCYAIYALQVIDVIEGLPKYMRGGVTLW